MIFEVSLVETKLDHDLSICHYLEWLVLVPTHLQNAVESLDRSICRLVQMEVKRSSNLHKLVKRRIVWASDATIYSSLWLMTSLQSNFSSNDRSHDGIIRMSVLYAIQQKDAYRRNDLKQTKRFVSLSILR